MLKPERRPLGTRLADAHVLVDRRNAPTNNNRLLPHNMTLHFVSDEDADETTLQIRELGGTFAMDIILIDADIAAIAGASAEQVAALHESGEKIGKELEQAKEEIADLEEQVEDLTSEVETLKAQLQRIEADTLDWPPPEP